MDDLVVLLGARRTLKWLTEKVKHWQQLESGEIDEHEDGKETVALDLEQAQESLSNHIAQLRQVNKWNLSPEHKLELEQTLAVMEEAIKNPSMLANERPARPNGLRHNLDTSRD